MPRTAVLGTVSSSPEHFASSNNHEMQVRHGPSISEKTFSSPVSVCGVERIDDVGFDAPTWRNVEAVLAGPLPDRVQLLR